ncbi:MAG: antitoxin VapB family protein [Candidatus Bathyarchaeia archaeon]
MTKTISIRDEVYRKLMAIKRENESFSELFERLAEGMDPLETLRRLRGCVEFEEKKEMISEMYSARGERRYDTLGHRRSDRDLR